MRGVSASILAAGLGSRLGGQPKAALRIAGRSLLERTADALRGAGIEQLRLVLGPYRETLQPLAEGLDITCVAHAKPTPSLIDSQRLALSDHLQRSPADDLLLVLCDLPLLAAEDVRFMLDAWQHCRAEAQACLPVVDGVRGHPLLLRQDCPGQILELPAEEGIRSWLARHEPQVRRIHCQRPAFIRDLDTPEDLAAFNALCDH